nr:serine protease [uncultured Psychroserpens sp.]
MKTRFILIIGLSFLLSACQTTVEELTENYTINELEELYSIKTNKEVFKQKSEGLNENTELQKLSERTHQDTILKAIKVIYGPDDRVDFYEEKDIFKKKNSFGVVALIRKYDLEEISNNSYSLSTIPFRDSQSLCASEKFGDQPIGSFCSGFAIDKNIIITAGHCVESESDLQSIRFLFDFKAIDAERINTQFGESLIFSGKRIISRGLDNSGIDYAIIEINEEIPSNRILKLNTTEKIRNKEQVYVIGHPVGLPLKIADGAFVRDNTNPLYFSANLDTYGGNSGSPVFNSNSHLVEGILVRGETDFIDRGGCNVSYPCPNTGCRGEDVSRISQFLDKIQ